MVSVWSRLLVFPTNRRTGEIGVRLRLLAVTILWICAGPGLMANWPLEWRASSESVQLFFDPQAPSGPARGLPQDEFRIFDDGQEVSAEQFQEIGEGGTSLAARTIIFYFSESLDSRQLFRSKRTALRLLEQLDPSRDHIAVFRSQWLSAFRKATGKSAALIRYFGVDDGLRFVARPKLNFDWRRRLSQHNGMPSNTLHQRLEFLFDHGATGNLTSIAGRLQLFPGRKFIIFFGNDLPYQSTELGFHHPELAARPLVDAGISLYAIPPDWTESRARAGSPAVSDQTHLLRLWTESTGGALIQEGTIDAAVERIQRSLGHYYGAVYRRARATSCRFRTVEVFWTGGPQPQRVYSGGYFATGPESYDLADRTFVTVFENPGSFQDFPLNLAGQPVSEAASEGGLPATRPINVVLSFPIASLRLEPSARVPDQQIQAVHFFVGIFDKQDQLIDSLSGVFPISISPGDPEQLLARKATLKETVYLPLGFEPARLQAIVVVGLNRQISTQDFTF